MDHHVEEPGAFYCSRSGIYALLRNPGFTPLIQQLLPHDIDRVGTMTGFSLAFRHCPSSGWPLPPRGWSFPTPRVRQKRAMCPFLPQVQHVVVAAHFFLSSASTFCFGLPFSLSMRSSKWYSLSFSALC